jgi:hypothetical protein
VVGKGAGSAREQADRKAAQLERARNDPHYSRVMFGVWPPPDTGTPLTTQRKQPRPPVSAKPKTPRKRIRQSDDAEYREQLGVDRTRAIPKQIGQAQSAGGARGGKGSSQRGRGKTT